MDFMGEVKELQKKIENTPKFEPQGNKTMADEEVVEKHEIVASTQSQMPKMTQEQANAVMDVAKNPKDFIGVKVSQRINDLAENDEHFSQQLDNVAQDTTMTAIQSFSVDNKKQQKANFFELNEKDIAPLGGDRTSSKGQQVSIVLIRRLFWILLMSTIGFFYVAPWTVMVELFQGITFKTIEKTEVATNGEKKTKSYITRTKLGKAGTVIGMILGFVLCVCVATATYFYPMVFLYIATTVFGALLLVNLISPIHFNRIGKIFKGHKDSEQEVSSASKTIEVEEE